MDTEEFIMKGLLNDLKEFNRQKEIDLIVITGDLIDKGGESFEAPEIAFISFEDKVLEPLCTELNLQREQIFFVPGNHDIQRYADEAITENGLGGMLTSTIAVNKYIDSGNRLGAKRIDLYKEFERTYYKNYKGEHELTDYQSCFKSNSGNLSIGITCFNSAWRCFDSVTDRGRIILGERQITNARKIIQGCDVKIALIHHPLDWLDSFEVKSISAFVQRDYNLLFCGHIHEGSSWSQSTMHGNQFVSVAPSNWTYNFRTHDINNFNGYSIIDYDKIKNQVITHNRRYSYNKEIYDPNTELGDSNGNMVFTFPDTRELLQQNFQIETAQKISEIYFESSNEHLLSFSSDTTAPKTIQEIFVSPLLVDKPLEDKGKRKTFKLEDLCNSSENLLVLGSKESGKTVLLDRILIELTENIGKYQKIPVLINFEDFTHSRFETSISHFLGVPITSVNDVISNHKITLLIDNLDFKKGSKIISLEKFIIENTNIQVIACTNYLSEGEVPLELLEYKVISRFKSISIKQFEARQIRELMHKWFCNNKVYDTPEKLNKLLQFIMTLNISRTPLAVSMFLWIFEQQGNYKPVNNAIMLQNFIERLFKKLSKKEIYSETFDFTNKERLLTNIARKMYDSKCENYGIQYNELRDFIRQNIKKKKFESIVNDEDVLQDFIFKGILTVYSFGIERYVRFKFNCFFQYLLMKNMDIDPSFKEFVLKEENFLNFTEEIDYYTGFKRDQTDILEIVNERMKKQFADIINKISEWKYGFDTLFETKVSIASTLDSSFVRKITERNKPSEEELDQIHDSMLDTVKPDTGIQQKEEPITNLETLWRLWTLTAKVLKNTEETEIENLKADSYSSVLSCSMAFCTIYKFLLSDYLDKNKDTSVDYFQVLNRLLPLAHQHAVYSLMGTAKLLVVIREKIDKELRDVKVSDFEKYLSVFMYADLKGENYHKYIEQFLTNTRRSYMHDMILLKLLNYYYLRSGTKQADLLYENLIADVIVSSKGATKNAKGKIMEDYRQKRNKRISGGDEEGLIS